MVCTCRVSCEEVFGRAGYGGNEHQFVSIVKEFTGEDVSKEIAPDWAGLPSVPVDVAERILTGMLAHVAAHNAAELAHNQYLERRREQAAADRQAIADRDRRQREAKQRATGKAIEQQNEARAREQLRKEQEAAARKRGNPVSLKEFKNPVVRKAEQAKLDAAERTRRTEQLVSPGAKMSGHNE